MICLVSSQGQHLSTLLSIRLNFHMSQQMLGLFTAFHTNLRRNETQNNVNSASWPDNKKKKKKWRTKNHDMEHLINQNRVLFARLYKMSGSHFLSQQRHFILTRASFKQMNSFCLSWCYLRLTSICLLKRGNLIPVTGPWMSKWLSYRQLFSKGLLGAM